MRTIKCTCGKTAGANSGGNVEVIMQQTGFYPVISTTGRVIWLCKSCTRKAAKLINELMEITQDEYCMPYALRGPQLEQYLK